MTLLVGEGQHFGGIFFSLGAGTHSIKARWGAMFAVVMGNW